MPQLVVNGASLKCSEGSAPSKLVVPPTGRSVDEQAMATEKHHLPNSNIMPFGMCKTLQNPQVQAATSAANGALTPVPCVPSTTSPWKVDKPLVKVDGAAALTSESTCQCQWGGQVSVDDAATAVDIE